VDKIVEEHKDIFSSPTRVPVHCQVKHSIDLTPDAPLPNNPVYRHSHMENEEIKCHIQEIILKGYIRPSSSPCDWLALKTTIELHDFLGLANFYR
jgi:hypothetical protein